MAQPVPIVLIPGLTCTARLYAPQLPALWPFGPVTIADHRRDDSMEKIAARILADAPPSFALAGLSMGGYIAFAILRLAPERITRLALLDTSARADTPEQTALRKTQIAMAQEGRYGEIADLAMPRYLHADRQNDEPLKTTVRQMADETGSEAFVRQMTAIMTRPDSRPLLPTIKCPTLVLVGDGDVATPPELSREIAAGIPRAKLCVVRDCGHLSTLERPEPVNAALVDWLRG
ncbi:MAG TPA: alpha/beta fold hydrolase [Pseudolabrys sp.]|nr:alpha/beta fold hydrolase [Pseudolabrys sp.]